MKHTSGTLRLAALCVMVSLVGTPLFAQDTPSSDVPASPSDAPPVENIRPPTLDELFERIASAGDAENAAILDVAIAEMLDAAGGPTAQLLSQRALAIAEGGDFAAALRLADAAVAYAPRYAEGFNARAAIFALKEDLVSALTDLQRTLEIEPRHYRALATTGAILESFDDNTKALDAYDRALALYPFFEDVRKVADELRAKIAGDRI